MVYCYSAIQWMGKGHIMFQSYVPFLSFSSPHWFSVRNSTLQVPVPPSSVYFHFCLVVTSDYSSRHWTGVTTSLYTACSLISQLIMNQLWARRFCMCSTFVDRRDVFTGACSCLRMSQTYLGSVWCRLLVLPNNHSGFLTTNLQGNCHI